MTKQKTPDPELVELARQLIQKGKSRDDVLAAFNHADTEERHRCNRAFVDEVLPVLLKHGKTINYCGDFDIEDIMQYDESYIRRSLGAVFLKESERTGYVD